MKNKMKEYFRDICLRTGELTTCQSKEVGALLIRDKRVIAMGYNGVPSGMKHCNTITFEKREDHWEWSANNELHAEQNVIAFCANYGISTKDTTLLISLSPCIHCAKLLINSGINEIIYLEEWDKDQSGIMLLRKAGKRCVYYDEW